MSVVNGPQLFIGAIHNGYGKMTEQGTFHQEKRVTKSSGLPAELESQKGEDHVLEAMKKYQIRATKEAYLELSYVDGEIPDELPKDIVAVLDTLPSENDL